MADLQEIVRQNRAGLSGIQAEVLKHRFGLGRDGTKEKTLEQVGYLVGVTKERVRQIQNRALIQIRAQMESKSIDQLIEENPDLAKKYYGSAQAAQIERAASG
jgi:RNA polymerase primary sigma factor